MQGTTHRDYFRVTPTVVQTGTEARISIAPLFDHVRIDPAGRYEVTYTPLENKGSYDGFSSRHRPEWRFSGDTIEITQRFDGEQEHSLLVEEICDGTRRIVGDFRVYSVEQDLFPRRPFKGDMHIHSNRSDGRESPGYVAAACRAIGFDFMALTDHGLYGPSIEAQEAFKDVDVDLRIYRGEEVHPPDNPVHIINFGGSGSVNDLFSDQAYATEVAALEVTLGDVTDERDRYCFASSVWCFRKIRELGGLGIFCHPYWQTRQHYHIPVSFTDLMFEKQPFDAYELIGGYHLDEVESNALQVLRYQEERARGRRLPVVGVSDAHGCDRGALFGWYYTVVFSPTSDLQDLTSSVKELYSVAVEHLPGASPRVHGPMRMASYAHFLLREVMREHDRLCAIEGELMFDFLAGRKEAASRLSHLSGRAASYLDCCFAQT